MEDNVQAVRVREAAANLASLVDGSQNFPLENYIDKANLYGLCDSLQLESSDWNTKDLEVIFLARDGLYRFRDELRNKNDSAEHSIDFLISALDRLYADLDRVLQSYNSSEISKALGNLAALQNGRSLAASNVQNRFAQLGTEASELLTTIHVTNRVTEINFIKIDRSSFNFEILKKAKLNIKRLSASVFAIKLSLEQSVVFEGMFQFLHERADAILDSFKSLISQIQESYTASSDFVAQWRQLAEKGSRFTKQVGNFLSEMFSDRSEKAERHITFKAQQFNTHEAFLCSTTTHIGNIALGGRRGKLTLMDPSSGRIVAEGTSADGDITAIEEIDAREFGPTSAYRYAFGTDRGLEITNEHQETTRTAVSERVSSIYYDRDGSKAIITTSKDGSLRRYSQQALEAHRSVSASTEIIRKFKSVQKILATDDVLVIAASDEIAVLSKAVEIKTRIPARFYINDMIVWGDGALAIAGDGGIGLVHLADGGYSRLLSAAPTKEYTCLCKLDDTALISGTKDGLLIAFDINTNEELGRQELGFELRGLLMVKNKVFAYGGSWNGKGKASAIVIVESLTK